MSNAITSQLGIYSPEPKSRLKTGSKDDKKNHIKRMIKDKLNLSNVNELVLCDRSFNNGMFGCLSGGQAGLSKAEFN
jgi:hypothetical protein